MLPGSDIVMLKSLLLVHKEKGRHHPGATTPWGMAPVMWSTGTCTRMHGTYTRILHTFKNFCIQISGLIPSLDYFFYAHDFCMFPLHL